MSKPRSQSAKLKDIVGDSWLRPIVEGMLSTEEATRRKVGELLRDQEKRKLTTKDGRAILTLLNEIEFPLPKDSFSIGPADLITKFFWDRPIPKLIKDAKRTYVLRRDAVGGALLAYFGATRCREGAEAFVECVTTHGWPETVYPRVFTELRGLFDHCDVLFPALIENHGGWITRVADVLISALSEGRVSASALENVAPVLATNLQKLADKAKDFQKQTGVAWRWEMDYKGIRTLLGVHLDLAGWLPRSLVEDHLRRVSRFSDPKLLLYAVISLLRLGYEVKDSLIKRIAESHETRDALFDELVALKLESRFPKKWRTWEAFAAANMVDWLTYPTELGREPDFLEKMGQIEGEIDGTLMRGYLWRFKNEGEAWFAGTSGLYQIDGDPKPCSGSQTFSSFEEWDSATPEQHLQEMYDVINEALGEAKADDSD